MSLTFELTKEALDDLLEKGLRVFLAAYWGTLKRASYLAHVVERLQPETLVWVPVERQKRIVRGSIVEIEIPLYPHYVFMFLRSCPWDFQQRLRYDFPECYFLSGQIYWLENGVKNNPKREEPYVIPRQEIIPILDLIEQRREQPKKFFEVGTNVRVTEGPFKDSAGEILESLPHDRFSVSIEIFGRPVPVEIAAFALERI